MKSIIIIPALNPDAKLVLLADELIGAGIDRIIIVNDGSDAACFSVFQELKTREGVTIIDHPVNLGKGVALKTAFSYCVEHFADMRGVVTADCDGQHTVKDILRVAGAMSDNPGHLVMGVRTIGRYAVPWRSSLGNGLINFALRLLYRINIADTQTGLRGIPAAELSWMYKLDGQRYEYELNMIIKAKQRGVEIIELPIETLYFDGNQGSHYSTVKDSLLNAGALFRNLVRVRRTAKAPAAATPSVRQILIRNIFTLFNFINLSLALLLIIAGEPKNALFVGVALTNTFIGAFQELRAKRTLDKLSILVKGGASVVRNGAETVIRPEEIVTGDIMRLSAGDQVYADAVILSSNGLEASESFLTGESDNVRKQPRDTVLSGSFITAGRAIAKVTAVGADSFASSIAAEAKKEKVKKSRLMYMLNTIIRILTFIIVPLGILLYFTEIHAGGAPPEALPGVAAAVTGMIPQGLVLLTGLTLVLGAVGLGRRGALVQSLYSIETLARTDVLCLDKTGTMTDGTLAFHSIVPQQGFREEDAGCALSRLLGALGNDNATSAALRSAFSPSAEDTKAPVTVPFSSERKWSGAYFEDMGSVILGVPDIVLREIGGRFLENAGQMAAKGYRVLCLARSPERLREDRRLPKGLICMAFVILTDNVRDDAPDTFRYFTEQGMAIKVISGDDHRAASAIAARAGLPDADNAVDMSCCTETMDLSLAAEKYTVFGRVSPHQKRDLVKALQKNGHVVCMTGDGVNDVLAMKAADCGVAMMNGSGAARGVCDFVLMSSDFSSMINILNEGRRVINNINKVSALYLVRTIYSIILAVIYVFLPFAYPFEPVQMTAINSLIIGIPTFFLAMRPDKRKPEGRFSDGFRKNSLPAAIAIVFEVLAVQSAQIIFGLSAAETSTMCAFLIGSVGFAVLVTAAYPFNKWIGMMFALLIAVFLSLFTVAGFLGNFFALENLSDIRAGIYLPLLSTGLFLFWILRRSASGSVDKRAKITYSVINQYYNGTERKKDDFMKKSSIVAIVAVVAIAGALFIAPVQTFAINAMGIFRVSDPNVINISAQDVAEITQNVQSLMDARPQDQDVPDPDDALNPDNRQDLGDTLKQYATALSSASDFTAFSFKLPSYLKDQTPDITQIDLPAQTITVDTASINEILAELNSPVALPDNLNGRRMTVTPSPMVIAEYQDAVCFAVKKPEVDLPGKMDAIITQAITTLPLLPDDIRSQLSNIDLFDKNIYLPNVEGVTKVSDLGGNTGYIYAVNDIASAAGLTQELQDYAGYEAILWVENGTLYGVAGQYTDDELAAIARTMR